jgi:hypothetical protein
MNLHGDNDKDPMGKLLFCIIIILLAALVAVQVGIAKGRQMERDRINSEKAK